MASHRWNSPQEWLNSKIYATYSSAELGDADALEACEDLKKIALTLALSMGDEAIQDLYEARMAEDGYFEEIRT